MWLEVLRQTPRRGTVVLCPERPQCFSESQNSEFRNSSGVAGLC